MWNHLGAGSSKSLRLFTNFDAPDAGTAPFQYEQGEPRHPALDKQCLGGR